MTIKDTFKAFSGKIDVSGQKLTYTLITIGLFCLGLYKFKNLGILPVMPIDWVYMLAPEPVRTVAYLVA